jgi:rfaE bifunctional protein nucleotidyltransferase chain/domain
MPKKRIIFTNGCFDVLHRGHIELLQFCKSLGHVVVGLNSDESVKKLKGQWRPVFSQKDRKFMLESCKYVDEVIIFSEDTPLELVKKIKPNTIVKGGDYKKEDIVGAEQCDNVIVFNFIDGYSTTQIIQDLSDR